MELTGTMQAAEIAATASSHEVQNVRPGPSSVCGRCQNRHGSSQAGHHWPLRRGQQCRRQQWSPAQMSSRNCRLPHLTHTCPTEAEAKTVPSGVSSDCGEDGASGGRSET